MYTRVHINVPTSTFAHGGSTGPWEDHPFSEYEPKWLQYSGISMMRFIHSSNHIPCSSKEFLCFV